MLRADYWIAALVPLAVQAALFVRWLHRRTRDDEIHRAFIRDMATNHLPHVYAALREIAQASGITLDEPPMVRYIEFRNGEGKRSK
jgi:hypothetical protein